MHEAGISHGCTICRRRGNDRAGREHGAQGARAAAALHLTSQPSRWGCSSDVCTRVRWVAAATTATPLSTVRASMREITAWAPCSSSWEPHPQLHGRSNVAKVLACGLNVHTLVKALGSLTRRAPSRSFFSAIHAMLRHGEIIVLTCEEPCLCAGATASTLSINRTAGTLAFARLNACLSNSAALLQTAAASTTCGPGCRSMKTQGRLNLPTSNP